MNIPYILERLREVLARRKELDREFWMVLTNLLPAECYHEALGGVPSAKVRFCLVDRTMYQRWHLFIDKDCNLYLEGMPPKEALLELRYDIILTEAKLVDLRNLEKSLEESLREEPEKVQPIQVPDVLHTFKNGTLH